MSVEFLVEDGRRAPTAVGEEREFGDDADAIPPEAGIQPFRVAAGDGVEDEQALAAIRASVSARCISSCAIPRCRAARLTSSLAISPRWG
jgi:hypothetical protein